MVFSAVILGGYGLYGVFLRFFSLGVYPPRPWLPSVLTQFPSYSEILSSIIVVDFPCPYFFISSVIASNNNLEN